jgi:cytosine/adenosine deaminase-related metal-dependent hydrolase
MSGDMQGIGPDRTGKVLDWQDGEVVRFGAPPPSGAGPAPARRIDATGCLLKPGDVNAHTHLYAALTPFGMPAPAEKPQNFLQILERICWRLDRALDRHALRAAVRYGVAVALRAGTTTVVDHHESPSLIKGSLDIVADACQELGIRAVLCYGATERNGGRAEAQQGLEECQRFLRRNRRPLVRGVVGLHASFTVSDETVEEAGQLCRELGTVLHLHLAEDPVDIRDARDRGYLGPLERLRERKAVLPGSLFAHGVHLDRDQVRKTRKYGCWLIQCPHSNLVNDVGYPLRLIENDRVALGTDGFPSNMREEEAVLIREGLKHGEKKPALELRRPASRKLAGERLGIRLDPLGPGAAADVVAVGPDHSARHVVVAGRLVVENGRLLTGDFDSIRADARAEAQKLWGRIEKG